MFGDVFEALYFLFVEAFAEEERVNGAVFERVEDVFFAVCGEVWPLCEGFEKFADELLLFHDAFLGEHVLAFFEEFFKAEVAGVAEVFNADDFSFERAGEEVAVDEFVFDGSGPADDDAFQLGHLEELVFGDVGDFFEVVVDGDFSVACKSHGGLAAGFELAGDVGVGAGEGDDGFAFEEGEAGVSGVEDDKPVDFLAFEHVFEQVELEVLVAPVHARVEWHGWLDAPDANV